MWYDPKNSTERYQCRAHLLGCLLCLEMRIQVNMIKVDDVPKEANDRYLWMDLLPLLPPKFSESLRSLDATGELCSHRGIVRRCVA